MSERSIWRAALGLVAGLAVGLATSTAAAQAAMGPSEDPRDPHNDPADDAHPPSLVPTVIAFSLSGVGLVTFGVTGALWLGEKSTVDELCPDHRCTSQEGLDAARSAQRLGVLNGVGLGLGLVGAVTGGVLLWKTQQDAPRAVTASVRLVGDGVSIDGRF